MRLREKDIRELQELDELNKLEKDPPERTADTKNVDFLRLEMRLRE
jgi:hypothetical protein